MCSIYVCRYAISYVDLYETHVCRFVIYISDKIKVARLKIIIIA